LTGLREIGIHGEILEMKRVYGATLKQNPYLDGKEILGPQRISKNSRRSIRNDCFLKGR
jgi:hypothetical protein